MDGVETCGSVALTECQLFWASSPQKWPLMCEPRSISDHPALLSIL